MKLIKQITVVLCLLTYLTHASLVSNFILNAKSFWPRSKGKKKSMKITQVQDHEKMKISAIASVDSKLKTLPKIQYELPAENEEFLKEGLTLINAPRESLDLCTHRVVQTLAKDCNKMNLEEIGKLAVMMLNCQLEIEGREVFTCKPEMVKFWNFLEFL